MRCCNASPTLADARAPLSARLDVAQQQFEGIAPRVGRETGAYGQMLAGGREPHLDRAVVGLAGFACKFDRSPGADVGAQVLCADVAKYPDVRVASGT